MGDRQTSGSITIDTTAIASAVARGITPALAELNQSLAKLTAGLRPAVGPEDVVEVIYGLLLGAENARQTAEDLAYRLGEMGYLLVHAPVPDLVDVAVQSAGDLDKDTTWFDPDRG